MKIIGVEIRFGVEGGPIGRKQFEAKIVPLAIEVPEILAKTSWGKVTGSVTVHTSEGDITTELYFPDGLLGRYRWVDGEAKPWLEGVEEFARRIVAGS